jgi:hypothetical protein
MGISNSFGMLGPNHAQDDEGAADKESPASGFSFEEEKSL